MRGAPIEKTRPLFSRPSARSGQRRRFREQPLLLAARAPRHGAHLPATHPIAWPDSNVGSLDVLRAVRMMCRVRGRGAESRLSLPLLFSPAHR